jgi:hypothetical protein
VSRLPDWWSTKAELLPDPDTAAPQPRASQDWWEKLYRDDDASTAEPTAEVAADHAPAAEEPAGRPWLIAQPGYYPQPHPPAWITNAPTRVAISAKTRSALYNASAAGTGWALGLYDQFAHAIASCGSNYSVGGALVLGTGGCLLIAHVWDRRTRHWWPGIAWAARIPLATALLALALWAPAP